MTESAASTENRPENALASAGIIAGLLGLIATLLGFFGSGGQAFSALLIGLLLLGLAAQIGIGLAFFRAWRVERQRDV